MKPIKTLIVDKNILARQALTNALRKHSHFNVKGVYGDSDSIEKDIQSFNPDVLLLDLDASESLETLGSVRMRFPKLPVIVLSPRSPEGAKWALSALEMGALDFITKPRTGKNLLFAGRHLSKRLIPILEIAHEYRPEEKMKAVAAQSETEQLQFEDLDRFSNKSSGRRLPKVIVVGACTGGAKALHSLLTALPGDFPIPIVVVQHFPKYYTKELAGNLNRRCELEVKEAYEGAGLQAGRVWVAPGGSHCEISGWNCRPYLRIHRGPRELGVRPSVNNLFRSASGIFGRDVLAILLSGHGDDGLDGIKAVKRAGGKVMVQHPDSARISEMPVKAIRSGYVDYCYPVENMGEKILEVLNKYSAGIKESTRRIHISSGFGTYKTPTKNFNYY